MSWFDDLKTEFDKEIGRGADDQTKMFYLMRDEQGNKDDDAPRPVKMSAEHPVLYRARENLGIADPDAVKVRRQMGMGLAETVPGRIGQMGGAIGADLIQDKTRSWWWLMNAAQASGNVINELSMAKANPDLYGAKNLNMKWDLSELEKAGYAHKVPSPSGESEIIVPNERVYKSGRDAKKRNYRSGMVTALGIPAGFAINQGLGLMTPFGGYEGYEAVMPSENDPSKTSNVVGEIASKYILGRTGNLLDWDEFKKVRPDVSKGEYNAYKAFKYDKAIDINPFDDGNINPLPGSVVKATTDGIHGAEIQFLGRSLPLSTAVLPFAAAVAGSALGVRKRRNIKDDVDRDAIKRGLIGGTLGATGGLAMGSMIENERRRRNESDNQAYYDTLDKL